MTVHVPAQWLPEPELLDSLDTAALAVGTDGTVRHANLVATTAYAGPGNNLVGRPLTGLFAEGDREALEAVLAQVLSGDAWQGRVELPRGDGSTHDAEVSCTPLRDLDGVKGVLCVIIDFSPEGQRLRDARLLGGRLAMLARVTGELVRAEDLDAVSRIITSHSADAVGATIASLVLREGEDRLRLIALRGGEEGEAEQWASFPIDARTPAGDVVRTGTPVLITARPVRRALSRHAPARRAVGALPPAQRGEPDHRRDRSLLPRECG